MRSVKNVDKLVVNPAAEVEALQETAVAVLSMLNDVHSWRPANLISIDFPGNGGILENYDMGRFFTSLSSLSPLQKPRNVLIVHNREVFN